MTFYCVIFNRKVVLFTLPLKLSFNISDEQETNDIKIIKTKIFFLITILYYKLKNPSA